MNYLENDLIGRVKSPHVTPPLLAPKENNWKICVDDRIIYKIIIKY